MDILLPLIVLPEISKPSFMELKILILSISPIEKSISMPSEYESFTSVFFIVNLLRTIFNESSALLLRKYVLLIFTGDS